MIVMKFGGTSVEDAESIERVAEIIRARLDRRPIVVVSAMGKTTRKLLNAAEASARGDSRTTLEIIAGLKTRHKSEARQLVKNTAGRAVFTLIDRHFEELTKLLEGLAILGEVPPRGLDKILSYGELLSSAIVADTLAERGIASKLLDSRELIKTDDRYGAASPLFDLTEKNIRNTVMPVIENGAVPVIQGFIGSTREGATTTLGFEGSDYTAAIVGAALDADDIQIWKDVSGLMTADPALIQGARTVKLCTFAEAADLTYFGAKVLHPKAVHPAARKNIPVHIYNSKKPEATGTEITARATECANIIKSIAYKRPVTIINVTEEALGVGSRPLSANEFLRALLNTLNRHQVAPLLTAVSASSVALAVDSSWIADERERDLIEDLSKLGRATAQSARAIVSLVGEGLPGNSTFVGRAFQAIGATRLGCILHGSSPITLNLVVADDDVETVIGRLHDVFFGALDPKVFE
ncbi:MAG TPA: aspartate kinase [Blastocatellia bacterium]|nr:aspartate kinase [Blastocatellia bacterium]